MNFNQFRQRLNTKTTINFFFEANGPWEKISLLLGCDEIRSQDRLVLIARNCSKIFATNWCLENQLSANQNGKSFEGFCDPCLSLAGVNEAIANEGDPQTIHGMEAIERPVGVPPRLGQLPELGDFRLVDGVLCDGRLGQQRRRRGHRPLRQVGEEPRSDDQHRKKLKKSR